MSGSPERKVTSLVTPTQPRLRALSKITPLAYVSFAVEVTVPPWGSSSVACVSGT